MDVYSRFMLSNYDQSSQKKYPTIGGYDALDHYPITSPGIEGKLRINLAPPPVAS